MKKVSREIFLFLTSTVYIWGYYLLAVVGNPSHPLDVFVPFMIIGSFFGLPILLFIVIPIINGVIVGKLMKAKMKLRILIYTVISCYLLIWVFNLHMTISNRTVEQTLFPDGMEAEAAERFKDIQNSSYGEIVYLSHEYHPPYHSDIDAGNMSGTRSPSMTIQYQFQNCTGADCIASRSVEYDTETGKPVESALSSMQSGGSQAQAEDFVSEYIGEKDKLRYSIFLVEHADDGLKMNLRRYKPYMNFDIVVSYTEPFYAKGIIKEAVSTRANGEYQTESAFTGKTAEFIKEKDQVIFRIEGDVHTILIETNR